MASVFILNHNENIYDVHRDTTKIPTPGRSGPSTGPITKIVETPANSYSSSYKR